MAALMLIVTASFAQHNFYFWGKNGNVSIEPISEIDSLTFNVGNWLFQISKPVNRDATRHSFRGSAKVAGWAESIDVDPEVGICYSDENKVPTYNDFKKELGSTMQDYSFEIEDVFSGTTYYYRTYVKFLGEVYYSAVNSITTMGETKSKIINGHEFVDLGLPSGLLWAETNVGASSSSGYGYYFAWGETKTKSYYDWSTYKWGDEHINMTKYNSTDEKTSLDDEDDAATVKWGAPCRMPDSSEFEELYNKCDWSWQSNYKGTSGYLVTGPSGNTIFFPASGKRNNGDLSYSGSIGYYWSRSLRSDYTQNAHYLYFFNSRLVDSTDNHNRFLGFPVRPVAEK